MKNKKTIEKNNKNRISILESLSLIFALVSISFLLINVFYLIIYKDSIINEIINSNSNFNGPLLDSFTVSIILNLFIIFWLILVIIMSIVTYSIENKGKKWYWLLIVSMIALLTFRIDSFIFGALASMLYFIKTKKKFK